MFPEYSLCLRISAGSEVISSLRKGHGGSLKPHHVLGRPENFDVNLFPGPLSCAETRRQVSYLHFGEGGDGATSMWFQRHGALRKDGHGIQTKKYAGRFPMLNSAEHVRKSCQFWNTCIPSRQRRYVFPRRISSDLTCQSH